LIKFIGVCFRSKTNIKEVGVERPLRGRSTPTSQQVDFLQRRVTKPVEHPVIVGVYIIATSSAHHRVKFESNLYWGS
jgi:hypothetical protein